MTNRLARVALLALVFLGLVALPRISRADDLADAKAFIAKQAEQIAKGDVDALKAGFTARLQAKITKESVTKAQKEVAKMTIDDLVASVAASKGALKIKMKNGRTLTTLLKDGGALKADTLWFK
jgi:hypothetical protein